jgi:hypothetical protein
MFWNRKKQPKLVIEPEKIIHDSSIEIVPHKAAKLEVLEEARKANEQLNKLLVENGFTLKIYLAAGGSNKNH